MYYRPEIKFYLISYLNMFLIAICENVAFVMMSNTNSRMPSFKPLMAYVRQPIKMQNYITVTLSKNICNELWYFKWIIDRYAPHDLLWKWCMIRWESVSVRVTVNFAYGVNYNKLQGVMCFEGVICVHIRGVIQIFRTLYYR